MKTLHYKGSTVNAHFPYLISSRQKSEHTWFDKGILIVAVVSCSVAIAIANRPRPAEKLGLEYLKNGRYEEASSRLKHAIGTHGPSCESYLGLAKACNRAQAMLAQTGGSLDADVDAALEASNGQVH